MGIALGVAWVAITIGVLTLHRIAKFRLAQAERLQQVRYAQYVTIQHFARLRISQKQASAKVRLLHFEVLGIIGKNKGYPRLP